MSRWGKWGGWYGQCSPKECSYSIRIKHLEIIEPPFVFEEGPHIGARVLQLVGLRSAEVTATFRVEDGIVTSKGFGLDVPLSIDQWVYPSGSFWQRLDVGSSYWPSYR